MTLEELQAEVTRMEQRILNNENVLNNAVNKIESAYTVITSLNQRLNKLEEARKVQIQLNAEFQKGTSTPKEDSPWYTKIFK